jgi:MFS family permease
LFVLSLERLRRSLEFLRGNVLVLTITNVTGMFTRSMTFPYSSLFVLALGGEPQQIGLINSLRPLLGLLIFPIAGYLTDRTGRVKLAALGGYASAAVLLLYVAAPSWQVLAVAGILQGFMVIQFPPTSALLADSLSAADRGKGVAVMNSLAGILAVASPYIGGAILDASGDERGMRILYAVMTAIYLANAIILHRFLRETSEPTGELVRLADLPKVIADTYRGVPAMVHQWSGCLRATGAILTLGFTANAVTGAFWVVYAKEQIGLTATSWGLVLLVETLLRNIMYIPAGILADRVGRSRFVLISLLISFLAIPSFVLVRGMPGAFVVRGLIAISSALFTPACTALMSDTVPREMRGQVMAAIGRGQMLMGSPGGGTGGPGMGFLITIPVMLGSLVGGYLYDANPTWPWMFALVAFGISVILAWRCLVDPQSAHD